MTIAPVTSHQLKTIHWLGQYLGFYLVNFLVGALMLALAYPIVKEVVVPIASLVVPISHGTLLKTLTIYTVCYWLPVVWKGYRQLCPQPVHENVKN